MHAPDHITPTQDVQIGERAPRPVWLQGSAEPFLATLHQTPGTPAIGVVFCSPFGWEEMASFRPRRSWAEALAEAGVPSVRFDLPGTGDAGGGPESADRLDAWTDAVGVTARWLRYRTGCRRVVAVGISLGGLLALCAAARGAPVDDFVLWGVPPRGKLFTRELRAFGTMEAQSLKPDDAAQIQNALPKDAIAAGGYLLSAQTRRDLEGVDVATLALTDANRRAALLLDRDGIPPHEDLSASLRGQGVRVVIAPGRGYNRMLTEPQFARLPDAAVGRTLEFLATLGAGDGPSRDPVSPPKASATTVVTGPGGALVKEEVFVLDGPRGAVVGILSEPSDDGRRDPSRSAAVLLGGTGHRIGPNRLWVETARRWAARGIPTLRVDIAGAGDSGSPPPPDVATLYGPEPLAEVDWLLARAAERMQATQLFCVGLCAGAYWALHASRADRDDPVVPFMVNLPTLLWDPSDHAARALQHYRELLFRREAWHRLRRGQVSWTNAPRALLRRASDKIRAVPGSTGGSAVTTPLAVLEDLETRGVPCWFFFAGREVLQEQFDRDGVSGDDYRFPLVHVDVVPGQSDLHTLRPLWLQARLHERMDSALARELARLAVRG